MIDRRGLVGNTPLRQLVAPRVRELRAAQALRLLRRKRLRHRAVFPFETPPRRDPLRPLVVRVDGENAGHALDHHLAHVVFGLADERDARAAVRRHRPHPFGAGARLARAAPAEDQPGAPVSGRFVLMVVGVKVPPVADVIEFGLVTFRYQPRLIARR